MPRSDTPSGRRHYRLGPLALVAEPNVAPELVDAIVPRTSSPTESSPAAAMWLSRSPRPLTPGAPASAMLGGVAVWVDESAERATVIGKVGHATVDLRNRWARLDPGTDREDAIRLFDATTALILGRARYVLVDASAVIDVTGNGWLLVGDAKARTALLNAFVEDGFSFVSDGSSLLRRAHHQPETIVVESWHRGTVAGDSPAAGGDAEPDPGSRWRPVARVQGVVLAHDVGSSRVTPWHGALRTDVEKAVSQAGWITRADEHGREYLHGVLMANAARPCVRACFDASAPAQSVKPMRALSNALEEMLR